MLIIAERINASRANIAKALECQDEKLIRQEALRQASAGADYIDINAGIFPEQELELLLWLIDVVQEAVDLPLCLDSPDPLVLSAGLSHYQRPAMINSISLDLKKIDLILPMAVEYNCKVIGLCQTESKMPQSAQEKLDMAGRLVELADAYGLKRENFYIDPLVQPLSVTSNSARCTLSAISMIMESFPGVHTVTGLTNISYGLPARRLVNRTFLVTALAFGLDAAIIDPTDKFLLAALTAAKTINAYDPFCQSFLCAYRAGELD